MIISKHGPGHGNFEPGIIEYRYDKITPFHHVHAMIPV